MSPASRPKDELERLASALCDGEISRSEAQRLESLATQSPESLKHLVRYVQLHAELAWMLGLGAEAALPGPDEAVPSTRPRKTSARWTGIAVTAAVVLLVGLVFGLAIVFGPAPSAHRVPEGALVATLVRSVDARWSEGAGPEQSGAGLVAGQLLRLESGLAQIRFRGGARVILDARQAEAHFTLTSTVGGALDRGRLSALVPPKASGFAIATPSATITDLGTEIGVAVGKQGTSEVHVFAGKVEVRPTGPSDAASPQEVSADQAVRVSLAGGRGPQIRAIALASRDFLRRLPPQGPVERLRQIVVSDPHLIHHYPFEGFGRRDVFADRWNNLDLAEVAMHGGASVLDIYESAPGIDGSTTAVRTFRGSEDGDRVGVGLQSQTAFEPPEDLTVELLFLLESSAGPADAIVASAVAFQADPSGAGSLGVVADRGRLVFRPGQSAPDGAAPVLLQPDHWYYVAATFEARQGRTTVNGYLADLTQGDGGLVRVAQDLVLEGRPASGPLGIGKGFDRNGADAYPWGGRLDEIAIYAAVLDRKTLGQHWAALVEKP